MKEYSEQRTETAVKGLIEIMRQNISDTGHVIDDFEASHNDIECGESKHYAALVAGHFALKGVLEKINNQLNKQ